MTRSQHLSGSACLALCCPLLWYKTMSSTICDVSESLGYHKQMIGTTYIISLISQCIIRFYLFFTALVSCQCGLPVEFSGKLLLGQDSPGNLLLVFEIC